MTNLSVNSSITIDPSTPFCARTYYAALRGAGCDPMIRGGGLYTLLNGGREAGKWAAFHDPDGSQRLEFARAAWANRGEDEEVVLLGA